MEGYVNVMNRVQIPLKRKRNFSDDEDKAILEGVAKFPTGSRIKWTKIIDESNGVLCCRIGQQVKDRWVNLTKNNC